MSANRLVSRPFSGPSDLNLLLDFARAATTARLPGRTYLHIGDVIWRAFGTGGSDPAANARLWFDSDGLLGYAWFQPPSYVNLDIRSRADGDEAALTGMVRWAEHRCQESGDAPGLATAALESDRRRIELLERQGYERIERHNVLYRRSLATPIPDSSLPEGTRVRHATDADIDERAAVHRDAWSVWGPSPFSADIYRRLRAAPIYNDELDLVAETPEGTFASCCICWEDTVNGVGSFEPVGTRPAFTGQGLARATIFEGLRRLKQRGMHTAIVGTASINQHALVLYPSCGFETIDRELLYVKELSMQ